MNQPTTSLHATQYYLKVKKFGYSLGAFFMLIHLRLVNPASVKMRTNKSSILYELTSAAVTTAQLPLYKNYPLQSFLNFQLSSE